MTVLPRREAGRRGLLVAGAVLLLVVVLIDLLRADSFLRSLATDRESPDTPFEQIIDGVRGGVDRPGR